MKAVIMAGGKGTRISSVAKDIPKPMIPIGGRPVLEHTVSRLREQGFTDLILVVGYLGQVIVDYFGDGETISPTTGEPFGVHIEYYEEQSPLGSAGALYQLRDRLTEDFLLVNGDVLFSVDLGRFVQYHREKGGLATLLTHPNNHPYDSGLILADENGAVVRWLSREEERTGYYRNRVNAGLHILSSRLLDLPQANEKVDLDRQVLKPLAGTGRMYAYDSPEYIHDMGTPERYAAVCRDVALGRVDARNLTQKQRAVFLDRDGVINRYVGLLRNIDDFVLLPGAAEAVRRINEAGYLAIVVTNQPVIARGEVTLRELAQIHNKMETLLGAEGAFVDRIYFCPHHPHKGYPGEVAELKIDCACRKPKPGMLLEAAREFNIDLANSWMVGDRPSDVQAGIAAGCKTALVRGTDTTEDAAADACADSLLDFVRDHIVQL